LRNPPAPDAEKEITVDRVRFDYPPADDEREQFTVTLQDIASEKQLIVTPMAEPVAEQTILQYRTDSPPDPQDYMFVTGECPGDPENPELRPWNVCPGEGEEKLWNHKMQAVSSLTISGQKVVFERGHDNGLFDSFAYDPPGNPVDHIEKMVICADVVILRGELHLPQTGVEIFARELHFEDTEEEMGLLGTTPVEKEGLGNRNGAHGPQAGDVTLNVAAIYTPQGAPAAARLILDGGVGQDPAEGRNGTDSTEQFQVISAPGFEHQNVIYVYFYNYTLCGIRALIDDHEQRTNRCPGNGGRAGLLRAPMALGPSAPDGIWSCEGGLAGQRHQESYRGGRGGSPNPTRRTTIEETCWFGTIEYSNHTVTGEVCRPTRGDDKTSLLVAS